MPADSVTSLHRPPPAMLSHPLEHGDFGAAEHQSGSSNPSMRWNIAEDVFWERYGAVLKHPGGTWRPLPHLKVLYGQDYLTKTPTEDAFSPREGISQGGEPFYCGPSSVLDPWLFMPSPLDDGASAGRSAANGTRPRLLFQYKPYDQQDPLHLNDTDVAAVLEAAFGNSPVFNLDVIALGQGRDSTHGATFNTDASGSSSPASDVAGVILIKLVIDLYLHAGPQASFPLVLFMLQKPLLYGNDRARSRIFDFLLNLAIHGELLHEGSDCAFPGTQHLEALDGDRSSGDFELLQQDESHDVNDTRREGDQNEERESKDASSQGQPWPPISQALPDGSATPMDGRKLHFWQWVRLLLFRMLDFLAKVSQEEENSSSDAAWAAAASCLMALITFDGRVVRAYVEDLPLNALAEMLKHAQRLEWTTELVCWLSLLAVNLLYKECDGVGALDIYSGSASPRWPAPTSFLDVTLSRLDASRLMAFGGAPAIAKHYLASSTMTCRRAFFCVMFDIATGRLQGLEYANSEVKKHNLRYFQVPPQYMGHPSEVLALGAALLLTRSADAMHAVLPLSIGSTQRASALEGVSESICAQMTAAQALNLTQITIAPQPFVTECLHCMARMIVGDAGSIEENNFSSLLLREEGQSAAVAFLAGAFLNAYDHQLEKQASKREGSADAQLTVALLPLPPGGSRFLDTHSSSVGFIPLTDGASAELSKRLALTLAEANGAAALPFAHAVATALDHVRLRVSGLGGTMTEAPKGKAAPYPAGMWHGVDFLSLAVPTVCLALDWILLAPESGPTRAAAASCLVECLIASVAVRQVDPTMLDINGSHESLGEQTVLALSSRHVASNAAAGGNGSEGALEVPGTPPKGVAGGVRPGSPLRKIAPVTKPLAAAWRRLTAPHGGRPSRDQTASESRVEVQSEEASVRPLSAGAAAMSPSSSSSSYGMPPYPQIANRMQPALAAPPLLSPKSHAGTQAHGPPVGDDTTEGAQQTAASGLIIPPRVSVLGEPSLLDAAAARATAERRSVVSAAINEAAIAAAMESQLTAVESFLGGASGIPRMSLSRIPPSLLQSLFEALDGATLVQAVGGKAERVKLYRPTSTSSLASASSGPVHVATPGTRGAVVGAPPQRMAAIQAGKPLWDARAATAILFLNQGANSGDGMYKTSPAMLSSLLTDPDVRVRQHAAAYALRRLAHRDVTRFRAAMREVVARAQKADNERGLWSPEAQINAMLESRSVTVEELT